MIDSLSVLKKIKKREEFTPVQKKNDIDNEDCLSNYEIKCEENDSPLKSFLRTPNPTIKEEYGLKREHNSNLKNEKCSPLPNEKTPSHLNKSPFTPNNKHRSSIANQKYYSVQKVNQDTVSNQLNFEIHPIWRFMMENLRISKESLKNWKDGTSKSCFSQSNTEEIKKMKSGKIPKIILVLTDFQVYHEVVSAEFTDFAGSICGHFEKDIFNESLEWIYTDLDDVNKVRAYKKEQIQEIPLRTHMVFVLRNVSIYTPDENRLFLNISKRNIDTVYSVEIDQI